jgi:hypothetical protein
MTSLIEAMVEGLRQTAPFQSLPAMTRPQDELWRALNNTLLQLRQPLYYEYLHKPAPKDKDYDEAIQSGLAILHVYAANTGTRQAIVRLKNGHTDAISFQPRPLGANWTAQHLLQPQALLDPDKDPLTAAGSLPEVSTFDMLHMAGKVARAFAMRSVGPKVPPNGVATFEFAKADNQTPARMVYRPRDLPHSAPSLIVSLKA